MQCAELVAAHHGGFRLFCGDARGVGHQRDDGIKLGIDARDGGEMGVEHLDRADGFGRDQRRQFDGRLAAQVFGHSGFPLFARPVHEATLDREEQEI